MNSASTPEPQGSKVVIKIIIILVLLAALCIGGYFLYTSLEVAPSSNTPNISGKATAPSPVTSPVTSPATSPVISPATSPVTSPATNTVTIPATNTATIPAANTATIPAAIPATSPISSTQQPSIIITDLGASIKPGTTIGQGQYMKSSSGAFTLVMQSDTNLVLYKGNSVVWATGTEGKGAGPSCVFQTDFNLVVYSAAGAVWASGTNGKIATLLKLTDNGDLNMYNGESIVWSNNPSVMAFSAIQNMFPGIKLF